jgi:hypothetical protein
MYKKCLDGIYSDDPLIIYKLASAYYNNKDYELAYETIKKLSLNDGSFKKFNEWRLYVLIIEELGDNQMSEIEYEKFIKSNSDLEALYLYGLFLKKIGKIEESMKWFQNIVIQGNQIKEYTFHQNWEWIRKANFEIKKKQILK